MLSKGRGHKFESCRVPNKINKLAKSIVGFPQTFPTWQGTAHALSGD